MADYTQSTVQATGQQNPQSNPTIAKNLNSPNLTLNGIVQPTITPPAPAKETTVATSANVPPKIANATASLDNLKNAGLSTAPDGSTVRADGSIVPPVTHGSDAMGHPGDWMVNPTSGIEEFVPVGSNPSWSTPGTLSSTSDPSSPLYDPTQDPIYKANLNLINDMKNQFDASSLAMINSIHQQYESLVTQQQNINKGAEASREQSLIMGGGERYAQLSSAGVMHQQVSYGLNQIADLHAKETSAIAQAQAAQQQGDFKFMEKQVTLAETARKDKMAALQKQADMIAEVKKEADKTNLQVGKETAIGDAIKKSGSADVETILATLQAQGQKTITAKDIADYITNANPDRKAILDLLKIASGNNAPADVLTKIGQAKTLNEAYAAAAGYTASKDSDVAKYEYAKSVVGGSYSGTFQDWMKAMAMLKPQAAADVKQQTSGAGGGIVTIPTNTIAYQNQNPLNIKVGTSTQIYLDNGMATKGSTASDGGQFLKFNSASQAIQAGKDLLFNSGVYSSLTVDAAMKKWSNGGYDGSIAPDLKGKTISLLSSSEQNSLITAMAKQESGSRVIQSGRPDPNITDPNQKDPAIGGLTKNGLEVTANDFINMGGKMPALGLGQADDVKAARLAVIARAGEITGGNPALQQAGFKALNQALTQNVSKLAATQASLNTASATIKLAQAASEEVLRTGAKVPNNAFQWIEGNYATVPNLTKLEVYVYTVSREYAKVVSGSAASTQGLTDSATAEAGKLLAAAQSPGNFKAATDAMTADMNRVVEGQQAEQDVLKGNLSTLSTTNPELPIVQDEQQAKDKISTFTSQNKENSDAYNALVKAMPNATPKEIMSKLGIQ